MGHRQERHADTGHAPDLGGEHAAGVDHDLGLDVAAVGVDGADPAAGDFDAGDPGVGEDPAAAAAGAVGERVGQLRGVDVAVGRQPGGTEHAIGRHQREELLGLLGRDQLQRQAEGLGPAGLAAQLLHPLLRGGEADAAAFGPAGVEVGLAAEPAVELNRVHHHLRQRDRAAQLADQAGGVEGRARGELRALEQDDVVPTQFGQVVGERGAADAAADDHAAGAVGELSARQPRPPRAGPRSRAPQRLRRGGRSAYGRRRRSRSRGRRGCPGRRPTSPRGSRT